jgi:hypothetical protein
MRIFRLLAVLNNTLVFLSHIHGQHLVFLLIVAGLAKGNMLSLIAGIANRFHEVQYYVRTSRSSSD